MARQQLFTSFEVYNFKKALAQYRVKEVFILQNIQHYLDTVTEDTFHMNPIEFIEDLERIVKRPADSFLTDFEMRGCK